MKNTETQKVIDWLAFLNPQAHLMDGFDDALIGVVSQFSNGPLALYDRNKCIDVLMAEGLTESQAEEHFSFNCEGAWVGETTPCIAILAVNL